MKKIDLNKYLETLRPSEWEQFGKYILLTKKKTTYEYRLFDYLYGKLIEEKNEFPDIETIRKEKFSNLMEKEVGSKCSLLKKLLESYFVWKEVNTSSRYIPALRHEALLSRSLYEDASRMRKKMTARMNKGTHLDMDNLLIHHRVLHQSFFSYSSDKYEHGNLLLENSKELLIQYNKLINRQYEIENVNRRKILFKDKNEGDFELPQLDIWKEKVDGVLDKVHNMIENNSHEDYLVVFDFLMSDLIDRKSELYVFILMLSIQFRIREVRDAYDNLANDLLDLYTIGLKTGAFTLRGFINARTFGNIIDLACGLNDLDLAQHIMDTYGNKVEPTLRSEVKTLAKCQIYIAEGNYKKALSKLEDLKLKHFDHVVRYKWLKLVCLYEKCDSRYESFKNSFKMWVLRDETKLTPGTREALLNFIILTNHIANNRSKDFLLKEYKSKKNVMFRSWVEKKIKN